MNNLDLGLIEVTHLSPTGNPEFFESTTGFWAKWAYNQKGQVTKYEDSNNKIERTKYNDSGVVTRFYTT